MNADRHIEEQKLKEIEEKKRQDILYHSLHIETCDTVYIRNHKYLKTSSSQDPNKTDEYTFEFSFHLTDDVKNQLGRKVLFYKAIN